MSLLISNNLASSFCDLFVCFLVPSAAVEPLVPPPPVDVDDEEDEEETMVVLAALRMWSWYFEEDKGGEGERATETLGPGMM